MMHLLLLTAFLVGWLPWDSCGAPLGEDQPLEPTAVSLNESCREQLLQQAASAVLHLLRLHQPPGVGVAADAASQARDTWAREAGAPSAAGQSLNVSSNQTLLIQRGCCTQMSHRITLDDLGWQSWVLFPDSFVFTQCLGCSCRRKEERPPLPLWVHSCALGKPSHWPEADTKQGTGSPTSGVSQVPSFSFPAGRKTRHCCWPRRSSLPFVFLKADGSLVVRVARTVQDCHGRP